MNLLDRIKNWEYPKIGELAYKVFAELVSLIISGFFFYDKIVNSQNPEYFKIISFVVIIVLLVSVVFTLLKTRENHREMDRRTKFIEEIAKTYDPKCKIIRLHDEHIVKSNGDGEYVKTMCLATDPVSTDHVFWYEIGMGTTRENNSGTYNADLTVKNPTTKRKLSKIWFEKTNNRHRYAILLNPVLDNKNHETNFRAVRYWRGVWRNLVREYEDDGKIRIPQQVNDFLYTIELPKRYIVENFIFDNNNKMWKITKETTPHNTEKISIRGENIPRGVYEYNLSVAKKKFI